MKRKTNQFKEKKSKFWAKLIVKKLFGKLNLKILYKTFGQNSHTTFGK